MGRGRTILGSIVDSISGSPVVRGESGGRDLSVSTEPSSSSSSSSDTQRRYREFLDLLPLTLALAGLPDSERGRYFTEEQIETRLAAIRHAWRGARQVARECIQK